MSFVRIGNQNGIRAEIFRPRHGQWCADVETDNPEELSGDVRLVVQDLTLEGTIERGGISGGTGRYLVRGGLAWNAIVAAQAYQDDAGTGLRTVLRDLARDAGAALARAGGSSEAVALAAGGAFLDRVDLPPDVALAPSFHRPLGRARGVLAVLRAARLLPPWYVSDTGRTVFAERTSGAIIGPRSPARRDLTRGLRWTLVDAVAAFVPGGSHEGETVESVTIRVGRNVVVETAAVRP